MREYCFLLMNIRKYVVFSLVTPGVYSSTDKIPAPPLFSAGVCPQPAPSSRPRASRRSCAAWTRAIARIVATAAPAGDGGGPGAPFRDDEKKKLDSSCSIARAHASAVSAHPTSGSTRRTVEGET